MRGGHVRRRDMFRIYLEHDNRNDRGMFCLSREAEKNRFDSRFFIHPICRRLYICERIPHGGGEGSPLRLQKKAYIIPWRSAKEIGLCLALACDLPPPSVRRDSRSPRTASRCNRRFSVKLMRVNIAPAPRPLAVELVNNARNARFTGLNSDRG